MHVHPFFTGQLVPSYCRHCELCDIVYLELSCIYYYNYRPIILNYEKQFKGQFATKIRTDFHCHCTEPYLRILQPRVTDSTSCVCN